MEFRFDKCRCMQDDDGFWLCLRVDAPASARSFVRAMKQKPYTADLRERKNRRSLDANAYLWVLCQKIAQAVRNITKEDVYRDAVKHAGQFEFLAMPEKGADMFLERWEKKGLGWFAERQDDCKLPGCTKLMVYYGSSSYDREEMGTLLDWVVNLAKDLDIETETPDQLALMKARWGDAERTLHPALPRRSGNPLECRYTMSGRP